MDALIKENANFIKKTLNQRQRLMQKHKDQDFMWPDSKNRLWLWYHEGIKKKGVIDRTLKWIKATLDPL